MSKIVRPILTTIILLWFAIYPVWKYTVLLPGLRGNLEWVCDCWCHTTIFNWERLSACLSWDMSMLWIPQRALNGTYQLPLLWMMHRHSVSLWFHWGRKTHWFPHLPVQALHALWPYSIKPASLSARRLSLSSLSCCDNSNFTLGLNSGWEIAHISGVVDSPLSTAS